MRDGSDPIMSRHLIIQLARFGDLMQTAPLVSAACEAMHLSLTNKTNISVAGCPHPAKSEISTTPQGVDTLRQDSCATGQASPPVDLHLLVDSSLGTAARLIDGVTQVHTFDRVAFAKELSHNDISHAFQRVSALADELEKCEFDKVSNITHTPESAYLTNLASVKLSGGMVGGPEGAYSKGNWSRLFRATLTRRNLGSFHLVDLHLKLAELGFPNLTTSWLKQTTRMPLGLNENTPLLTIQLGTNSPLRTWPIQKFAATAKLITEALPNLTIALVGSAGEKALAADFEQAFPMKVINLAGLTDLEELAGVISQSSVVLSGDTGTIHLAAALNVPTVGIYLGMARADDTAPYRAGSVIFESRRECYPCPENHRCGHVSCHDDISPSAVAGALFQRISGEKVVPEQSKTYRSRVVEFDRDNCLNLPDDPNMESQNRRQFLRKFWLEEFTLARLSSVPSLNSTTRELVDITGAAISASRRFELALINGSQITRAREILKRNLIDLEKVAKRNDESGLLAHLFQLELENLPSDPRLIAGRIKTSLDTLHRRAIQFPVPSAKMSQPMRVAS